MYKIKLFLKWFIMLNIPLKTFVDSKICKNTSKSSMSRISGQTRVSAPTNPLRVLITWTHCMFFLHFRFFSVFLWRLFWTIWSWMKT